MSLKKQKSQGKAVEVTVNSKEENSYDFCIDFIQEFSLSSKTIRKIALLKLKEKEMLTTRKPLLQA